MGFQKIHERQIKDSLALFWAHGDNVLAHSWGARFPYNKEDLRLLLNLHTLFAEKLCVVDTSFLNNEPLRELFMYDGYETLLSKSIIVPMLRKSVNDFKELDYQLRQLRRYGLLGENKANIYADFLNEKVKTVLPTDDKYFTEVLTKYYETTLLNSKFLTHVGLQYIQKDLVKYITKYQKDHGLYSIWRSLFFYFADDLIKKGHPTYAIKLKWLSAAIWNDVFLQAIPAKPAFPHSYSEALNKMMIGNKKSLLLSVEEIKEESLENSDISLEDIQHLKAQDLVDIRKSDAAHVYFDEIRRADKENSPVKSRNLYVDAKTRYLASLSDFIAAIGTGKSKKYPERERNYT